MLVSSNTLLRRLCTWVHLCPSATRVRSRGATSGCMNVSYMSGVWRRCFDFMHAQVGIDLISPAVDMLDHSWSLRRELCRRDSPPQ